MKILFDDHAVVPNSNELTLVRVTEHANGHMLLSLARSSPTSDATFSLNLTSFNEIDLLERALQKAKENFTKVD